LCSFLCARSGWNPIFHKRVRFIYVRRCADWAWTGGHDVRGHSARYRTNRAGCLAKHGDGYRERGWFIGAVSGWYLDRTSKSFDNQIIVTPNFTSTDYLYSEIALINSKIKEGDTLFLKNVVGIKNPKKFNKIAIEPITDIYRFIGSNPTNFEFVKLLAEDGDLKKIVDDKLTSKNYLFHNITFSTSKPTSNEATVKPILDFLNSSEYYKKVQKEYVSNINKKIIENDSIISQINGILNSFSRTANGSQKSDKLVYYNENTQLNEVIKTKDELIKEQGSLRLQLLDTDKIIKETSSTINIKNTEFINGKRKFFVPIIFVLLFMLFGSLKAFYKKQLAKSKA
jgi:hypothetical protein